MRMNDYFALMTANRNHIQQLDERATLLASLGFLPSIGIEGRFRRRVIALEADFVVTRQPISAASSTEAA